MDRKCRHWFSLIAASAWVCFGWCEALQAQTLLEQAAERIKSGNPRTAVRLLRQELAKRPDQPLLWNVLGIAEAEQGKIKEAEQAFRQALKLDPHLLPANENLGLLLFRRGDYSEAGRFLETAVKHGGANPQAAVAWAEVLFRSGQTQSAIQQLRRVEASEKNSEAYWNLRGAAELAARDLAGAAASFDRALSLNPRSSSALKGAARVADASQFPDKAIALLHRARQTAPDDVATLVLFSQLCLQRDLIHDALEAAERASRLAPDNNQALYLLASAHLGLAHYQQAHELMSEFVRRVPGFPTAFYSLGWLDIKLGNVERARHELARCLELSPDFQDALCELAQLDLNDQDVDTAEKRFRRVLDRNPRHVQANLGMGDLLIRRGDLEQAEKHYERAIEADPDSGPAHYKLAMLLFKKKETARAEREQALAVELNRKKKVEGKTFLKITLPETSNH